MWDFFDPVYWAHMLGLQCSGLLLCSLRQSLGLTQIFQCFHFDWSQCCWSAEATSYCQKLSSLACGGGKLSSQKLTLCFLAWSLCPWLCLFLFTKSISRYLYPWSSKENALKRFWNQNLIPLLYAVTNAVLGLLNCRSKQKPFHPQNQTVSDFAICIC